MVATRSSSKRDGEGGHREEPKPKKHSNPMTASNPNNEEAHPRKRRRIKGALSLIMTMPVEVFCEIASFSSPDLLLRMARSSKTLRKLLMSKTSRSIWIAAEQAVGLPPCPPDLSCPEYASLIFDKFCMSCLAVRATNVDILTRSRLCNLCKKNELTRGFELLPEGMTTEHLSALIPGTRLIDGVTHKKWYVCNPRLYQDFYRPLVVRACQDYAAMGVDAETRGAKLLERSHLMYEIQINAKELCRWLKCRAEEREAFIRGERVKRRNAITRRLLDLGYSEEDLSPKLDDSGWEWTALINQSKELTEKTWNTLLPQLEKTLFLRKEKKLRLAKAECLNKRRQQLLDFVLNIARSGEPHSYLLRYREFMDLPAVDNVLKSDGLDSTISEDTLQVIKESVLEAGAKTKQKAVDRCMSSMMGALCESGVLPLNSRDRVDGEEKSSVKTADVLELNCAFFRRPTSDEPLPFFKILYNDSLEAHLSFNRTGINYFEHETTAPDTQCIKIANRLAESLNVKNLTMSELCARGEVFLCQRCDPILREKMGWQGLVTHYFRERRLYDVAKLSPQWEKDNLQSVFNQDHDCEDHALGELATDTSAISDPAVLQNVIKKETDFRSYKKCEICALVGLTKYYHPTERRVHEKRKHGPLTVRTILRRLAAGKL